MLTPLPSDPRALRRCSLLGLPAGVAVGAVVGRDLEPAVDDDARDGLVADGGVVEEQLRAGLLLDPRGVAAHAVAGGLVDLGGEQLDAGGLVDDRHLHGLQREYVDIRGQHDVRHDGAEEAGGAQRADGEDGEDGAADRGHERPPVGAWRRYAASGSLLNCWCKRPIK